MLAKPGEARFPVLVAGVEVHRPRLAPDLIRVAERLRVPVVSTFRGRGSLPAEHPLDAGTDLGPDSPAGVQRLVERADLALLM